MYVMPKAFVFAEERKPLTTYERNHRDQLMDHLRTEEGLGARCAIDCTPNRITQAVNDCGGDAVIVVGAHSLVSDNGYAPSMVVIKKCLRGEDPFVVVTDQPDLFVEQTKDILPAIPHIYDSYRALASAVTQRGAQEMVRDLVDGTLHLRLAFQCPKARQASHEGQGPVRSNETVGHAGYARLAYQL